MSEEILKALMQLFAIITKQDGGVTKKERHYVEDFLKSLVDRASVLEYLILYDEFSETTKKLYKELTEDSPSITFNAETGILELTGRSMPEDATSFYQDAFDWLDSYKKKLNAKTNVIFKLEYFNTASSKLILDLFTKLEGLHNNGTIVTVSWYYYSDDKEMLEAGEEFAELFEIPFEFKTY